MFSYKELTALVKLDTVPKWVLSSNTANVPILFSIALSLLVIGISLTFNSSIQLNIASSVPCLLSKISLTVSILNWPSRLSLVEESNSNSNIGNAAPFLYNVSVESNVALVSVIKLSTILLSLSFLISLRL